MPTKPGMTLRGGGTPLTYRVVAQEADGLLGDEHRSKARPC